MFIFPNFIETADKLLYAERRAAFPLWMSSFPIRIGDTVENLYNHLKFQI